VKNRERADTVRSAVLAALNGGQPDAVTAAVISLLHRVGGMNAALAVNDEGARRAGEIAGSRWGEGSLTAEVNLALTAALVLPALG